MGTQTIINALIEYLGHYGYQLAIVAENGSNFCSKLSQEFLIELSIEIRFTSVHEAFSNTIAETPHKILKDSLRVMSRETFEWDICLAFFKPAVNISINRATGCINPQQFFWLKK